jgi:hypothetical protein|tara:strand:- start:21 stop:248 length:228 start_codon:yes stop_codon:yes gene_type:complete
MDTEELEQYTEEGENRNTASLHGSIAGYQTGSAKTLFPVQKTDKVSVSFVSLPNSKAQPCCALSSERENSGFSIY